MFIELTEILKCPRDHAESYVILGPVTMDGRDVVRGGIVCPACRAEYPIVDRVAFFGPPDEPVRGAAVAAPSALTAEAVLTFLDLAGEGGYVVTVGAAGRLGPALGAALPRVGVVGVNPPAGTAPSDVFSVIVSPRALPVRARSVRAVVLGADVAAGPWLESSVAALLRGLRIVIEDESASPGGVTRLAAGGGVFVGEK
ncbi:MAG: Trm112 family protein [Gemmatimonadales bacterium]